MNYAADFSPTSLIRQTLSSRSDQALSALEARTAHSWMMALDRAKVLPETNIAPAKPGVSIFIKSGAGPRVTDIDGANFIDLCLGEGSQILGHAHPIVQQAIVMQSARGWQFDLPADGQLDLARLIQAAGVSNERVALFSSSDMALRFSLHAARAFTGKAGAAIFTGSQFRKVTRADEAVSVLPYGHQAALEQLRHRRHEIGVVLVEPVRASAPNLDHTLWLHALGEVCRETGALLVLDERQTGFRLAYGGAQEILGLVPDLVVYGNAVGGGMPMGAVAGRAPVMAAVQEAVQKETLAPARFVSPNPLSVTAGIATLNHLLASRAVLYPTLNEAGRGLANRLNTFAATEDLPVRMMSAGSMFRLVFGRTEKTGAYGESYQAAQNALNVFMLSRSVLMLGAQRGFLSTAHTAGDIDYVFTALADSLCDVRDDGCLAQHND